MSDQTANISHGAEALSQLRNFFSVFFKLAMLLYICVFDIGACNLMHTYIQNHYVHKKSLSRDRVPGATVVHESLFLPN